MIVLLHGFIKKSQATKTELQLQKKECEVHIEQEQYWQYFRCFLEEEALLDEATAVAVKRVISWQIAAEMKAQKHTETSMAKNA